jgi:hypothetical protein
MHFIVNSQEKPPSLYNLWDDIQGQNKLVNPLVAHLLQIELQLELVFPTYFFIFFIFENCTTK